MNERIKELRLALGISQQKFADRIGIARGNIAAYEVNKNEPSNAVISLICKEFDVSETWLREGIGEMFIEKSKDEQISEMLGEIQKSGEDSFKHRLVSALSELDENGWETLEKLIDSIAKK